MSDSRAKRILEEFFKEAYITADPDTLLNKLELIVNDAERPVTKKRLHDGCARDNSHALNQRNTAAPLGDLSSRDQNKTTPGNTFLFGLHGIDERGQLTPSQELKLDGSLVKNQERLNSYLKSKYGLHVDDVGSDGNCFFYSVAAVLNGHQNASRDDGEPYHLFYRRVAFDKMMRIAESDNLTPKEIRDLSRFKTDKVWAKERLIDGLARYLNMTFQVFTLEEGVRCLSMLYPVDSNFESKGVIPLVNKRYSFWDPRRKQMVEQGYHFQPVVPLKRN